VEYIKDPKRDDWHKISGTYEDGYATECGKFISITGALTSDTIGGSNQPGHNVSTHTCFECWHGKKEPKVNVPT
jgi:hypothetical protein